MRQRGHSHRHGGDEGPGQPEQQLHRQQEERQAEAQPHAGGKYRGVSDQHAEGERVFTASIFTVGTIGTQRSYRPLLHFLPQSTLRQHWATLQQKALTVED